MGFLRTQFVCAIGVAAGPLLNGGMVLTLRFSWFRLAYLQDGENSEP